MLASRARAQRSYRTGFRIDLASSLLVGLVELAEVWVLFHNVDRLGGVDFGQILLVFGLADLCFSLADLAFGHCDNLPTYIRAGTLDVFYLRPQPLLLQLVTSDISLRRLARAAVGLTALVVGLVVNDIDWSIGAVVLLALAVVSGVATFAAMFVIAGGLQFFLLDGAEMTNAFVYGGRYAATQPASVWSRPVKAVFGFLFPMAFTAYLPGVGAARAARSRVAAVLAGLVRSTGRGVGLGPRLAELALGRSALPRRRRMTELVIEAKGLTREFSVREGVRRRRITAVDDLTVSVAAGEAIGYIGANGAGKSTTIKMLCGILVPTGGEVRTCGLRPVQDRRRLARQIGVVFGQRSQLWWDLPVRESFSILAAIHSLDRASERTRTDELVERLEMQEFLGVPVRQLSLGQRMRAEVAAALLHSPRLVILDEPTIGLDVLSKQRLREFLIAERRTHGTTLLLTTHDMGDVERLCERVVLVDRGQLVFDGTLAGLSRTVGAERVMVVDLAGPGPDLVAIPGTRHLGSEAQGLRQRLSFDPDATTAARVLASVSEHAEVLDLAIEEPDVEDVVRRVYAARR